MKWCNLSNENDSIDIDIDESLDLSDLNEVDEVIDDLDKSLSDINLDEISEASDVKKPHRSEYDSTEESSNEVVGISSDDGEPVGLSSDDGEPVGLSSEDDKTGDIPIENSYEDLDATGEFVQGQAEEMEATGEIEISDTLDSKNETTEFEATEDTNDSISEGLENLDSIEDISVDFDPTDIISDESDQENAVVLPNFKECEDLSVALSRFEHYSIDQLNGCLDQLGPELFNDNGEYVRVKRKLSSLVKKKEQDIQDAQRREIEEIEAQQEAENNILPIDTLIKKASDDPDEIGTSNIEKKKNFISGSISQIKNLAKIKAASQLGRRKKQSETEEASVGLEKEDASRSLKSDIIKNNLSEPKKIIGEYFTEALKTRTFATGFLIIFEIVKTTLPAIIVGLFVLELNQKSVTPDILESLVSNDPARVQIGLELVKSNVKSISDRNKYYEIAKKKIEQEIDMAWSPRSGDDLIKKAIFSLSLANLKFQDEAFNLESFIAEKIKLNKKTIRSSYETFYNTEIDKLSNNSNFISNLREANIFLTNKKCLNALEKFIEAERLSDYSKSVDYGKTLAVNCISASGNRAIVTQKIFELQGKVDANTFLRETRIRKPAGKY